MSILRVHPSSRGSLLVLMGILYGVIALINPLISILLILGFAAFLILTRYPMFCWISMLWNTLILNFILPESLNYLAAWGLTLAFIVNTSANLSRENSLTSQFKNPIALSLSLFALLSIFAGIFSTDPIASFKEVVRYLLSFAVFFIYLNWLTLERAQKLIRWFLNSLSVGGLLIVLYSIAVILGMNLPGADDAKGQVEQLGWTLSILLILYTSLVARSWKKLQAKHYAYFIFLFVSIYFTESRTACLATGLGLFLFFWEFFSRKIRAFFLIAFPVVAILGFFALGFFYNSPLDGVIRNLSGRDFLWGAAMKAVSSSPFWGIGPGAWKSWLTDHYVTADFILIDRHGNSFALTPDFLGGEAHNLYITKIAEMGVLALPLLLCFILAWLRTAAASIKQVSNELAYSLSRGCFVIFISMAFYGLLENGPIIGRGRGPEVFVLWLIAAIPLVAPRWMGTASANDFLPRFLHVKEEAPCPL
jgi:O-antigen ligase